MRIIYTNNAPHAHDMCVSSRQSWTCTRSGRVHVPAWRGTFGGSSWNSETNSSPWPWSGLVPLLVAVSPSFADSHYLYLCFSVFQWLSFCSCVYPSFTDSPCLSLCFSVFYWLSMSCSCVSPSFTDFPCLLLCFSVFYWFSLSVPAFLFCYMFLHSYVIGCPSGCSCTVFYVMTISKLLNF